MFRDRARATLPTVILTLASIIQAVALEMYWNRLAANPELWTPSFTALLGWGMAAALLTGMLLLWVYYAQLVMRFVWVPQVEDSLLPFGFGLLEFALIEFMEVAQLPIWFTLYGTVFAFAGWVSYSTFSRARKDPDNAWFFTSESLNKRVLLGPTLIAAALFWGFAVLCHYGPPLLQLAAVLCTVLMGLLQLRQQHLYWLESLALEEAYNAAAALKPPENDAG